MPSATVATILDRTLVALAELQVQYATLARELECSASTDPQTQAKAQFAGLLVTREVHTIAAIRGYLDRDERHPALDVHVRLGGGFPFEADELRVPDSPTIDELIEVADRSDELLELLSERIELYAVAPDLVEALTAYKAIVHERRRRLAAAISELEAYTPSPPQSCD